MRTHPWVKNSNLDSQKTVIHLCSEVPYKFPRRAKAETYVDLTQHREINHPDKPLANENVHRLLKPGTFCEKNISQTLLNTVLFPPITY